MKDFTYSPFTILSYIPTYTSINHAAYITDTLIRDISEHLPLFLHTLNLITHDQITPTTLKFI